MLAARPLCAFADDVPGDALAYSEDESGSKTYYNTCAGAVAAGTTGKKIVMIQDWELEKYVGLEGSLTIEMNGHMIKNSGHILFNLEENAHLTLLGNMESDHEFSYYARGVDDGKWLTVKSGGLLKGWRTSSNAPVVLEGNGSKLTLENVAFAGDRGWYSGAISVEGEGCSVDMTGTQIINCHATYNGSGDRHGYGAGGVFIKEDDCTVVMKSSTIAYNVADSGGGGITSNDDGTKIEMWDHSTIKGNVGYRFGGGGIRLLYSEFSLTSPDGTGSIEDNISEIFQYSTGGGKTCGYGGGILVDQNSGTNEGLIEGLTISGNVSRRDGGGIYLGQEYTTVQNCTITGNTADGSYDSGDEGYGGGVYVDNDKNAIKTCAIKKNIADLEGGGVYVYYKHDLALAGKLTVEDNHRTDGADDDVFLDSTSNNWYWAYLTGNVDAGSHIGIRTGVTGKRRLTKEHSNYIEGTYFLNIPTEYHLSYVSSDDELWQQAGEYSYLVTINGVGTKRYKTGEKVTVSATDAEFAGTQTFLHWNPAGCTGLSPLEDYLTELSPAKITFTMPNNDVHLKATYVYPVIKAKLRVVDDFIAGHDLPTTALLQTWVEGASSVSERVPITWYKVNTDGSETEASGKAEYGCVYRVRATVSPRLDDGMVFSDNLASATTVEVAGTDYTESAKLNDAGALEMVSTKLPATVKAEVSSVESVRVTVNSGIKKSDFVAALPKTALATTELKDVLELETDRAHADLPQGLINSDGKVADPDEGDAREWKVTVPVKGSSSVADTDKKLTVAVTVLKDATPVNTPELVQEPGAYTRYDESRKLDGAGDLTVRVAVAGADAQTEIYYRINDGDEKPYSETDAIKLWHASDVRKTYSVTVWAVRGNVRSSEVRGIYVLDDTLQRELKIACKDTAIDSTWGAYEDFTVTGDVGAAVTAEAPEKEGRVFDHWEWEDAPDSTDLSSKKLVIPSFATDLDIVAVYAPVINSIRLEMTYPEAGEALSTTATKVLAKSGSASEVDLKDITEYFKGADGKVHITWTPADSTAKAGVSYTARIDLSGKNAPKGIKYALADEIDVDVEEGNDVTTVESSSVSGTDLIVVFPTTYTGLLDSIEQPGDVTVSFADALAGKWGLPEQAGLNLYGGGTDIGEISWEEPAGFDKNATDGQDLTVKGTVRIPSYVANEEVSTDVSLTIHVKAPAAIKAPIASLKEGAYEGTQTLALSCETAGATIHYTLDGSKPTASSPIFKDTIELTESAVVKAIAVVDGVGESDVASFTYTIKSEAKTHTVTFDTGLGSTVKAQTVADGACAKKPENPTLEGATFEYWALIDRIEYDFGAPVTGDVILYAVWGAKDDPPPSPVPTVAVTFDAAGGSSVAAQEIECGSCAVKPADPTRTGYTFSGWLLGKESYDFSAPVTKSITLTASWTKNDDKKDDSDEDDTKKDDPKKDDGETDTDEDKGDSGKDDSDKGGSDTGDEQKGSETKIVTKVTTEVKSSSTLAATGDRIPLIVGLLVALGILAAAAGIISKRKMQ